MDLNRTFSLSLLIGFLFVSLMGVTATSVHAQKDPIVFGFAQDFTRVYTFACQEINQGQLDYLELMNARGGIEGHHFEAKVTDTGNEPQRGIEAYERFKKQGAVLFDFCSTPVTNAIIPRALKDEKVITTIGYGRSDAVDGQTFPYIFPIIGNYWSQAARIIDYIDQQKGGIQGDRVAFIYLESAFGREPIPMLENLSQELDFTLETFPVPPPATEQSSAWSKIRRYRPDHIVQWFAGPSTGVSLREAIRNGFSPDQIHSVSWIEEKDLAQVRAGLSGVQRTEAVSSGRSPRLIQNILNEVYAADRGSGPIENVGTTYYNYGVGSMAVAVQGVRNAVENHGWPLTGPKLKDGLESIRNYDAEGLLAPVTLTPRIHNKGQFRIGRWNGEGWEAASDYARPYWDRIMGLVKESAGQYEPSE